MMRGSIVYKEEQTDSGDDWELREEEGFFDLCVCRCSGQAAFTFFYPRVAIAADVLVRLVMQAQSPRAPKCTTKHSTTTASQLLVLPCSRFPFCDPL